MKAFPPGLCCKVAIDVEQTTVYPHHSPCGQYLDLDGAEEAGLVNFPPMEYPWQLIWSHLTTMVWAGPLPPPPKHCRFSASQLDKSS